MNLRAEAKSETSIGLSWSPPRQESIIRYELLFREGDRGREVPARWPGRGGGAAAHCFPLSPPLLPLSLPLCPTFYLVCVSPASLRLSVCFFVIHLFCTYFLFPPCFCCLSVSVSVCLSLSLCDSCRFLLLSLPLSVSISLSLPLHLCISLCPFCVCVSLFLSPISPSLPSLCPRPGGADL